MALQQSKMSKSRTRSRRSHSAVCATNLGTCSHCGEPKKPHHICPSCGYYNDKEVVKVSGD
jgi:large subunit ribosomal protein L32